MKRTMMFLMAALALVAVSCHKNKTPSGKPSVTWEGNSSFAVGELTPSLDAVLTVSAPAKFQDLKLVLGLGSYNLLANPYIQISGNQYRQGGTNPVLDLVADAKSVSFLGSLGMSVGSSLQYKEEVKLDLQAILEKILDGQPVENNTTFTVEIRVVDQEGNSVSKTAKFHFTAAPTISWEKNASFADVDLDADAIDCKVEVWAPGKIATLTVKLEDGASSVLTSYVKNRTTDGSTLINLVDDAKVTESFKDWLPSGSSVKGKDQVYLNFGFLYSLKYDLEASSNTFTVTVVDQNGKSAVQTVRFKKN